MTSIRQRMRRLASAEAGSSSPEAEPGTVVDPAAAAGDAPVQPTVDAAASPDGTAAAPVPATAPAPAGTPPTDPTATTAPDAAPAPGAPGTAPAGPATPAAPGDPNAPAADPAAAGAADPNHPGFATRGRLRRRLRYLRRVRELGYRDLGGLIFDQHRFARPNETLVQTKVAALAQIDGEVRALENALEDKRAIAELREAGIAACPRCGAIHGSESRYCPACGLALSGPTEMAPVHAPGQPGAPVAYAPVPTPPNPVTIAPMPAPVTPPIVGPAATQPPTPPVASTPAPPVYTPPPAAAAAAASPPVPAPSPDPAPASAAPTPDPAAPAPDPVADQHTIHLRGEGDEQPTTVFRAADVEPGAGVSISSGDPLTGPQPADKPDLQSGDPLATKPDPAAASSEAESEPRS